MMTTDPVRPTTEGMPAVSRRNALALTGAGLASLVTGASQAAPSSSEIEALFNRWRWVRDHDYSDDNEEQASQIYKVYVEFQNRIVAAEPTSARDVGLQYLADSDMGDSEPSDAFKDRLRGLAGVLGPMQPVDLDVEKAKVEHPWDAARRLVRELADVLAINECGHRCEGPSGKWFATVYPAGHKLDLTGFGSIRSREWPRQNVSAPMQKVLDEHCAARAAFLKSCDECDRHPTRRTPSKAALLRYNRRHRAEEKALEGVCAFRPRGDADVRAKARYLKQFHKDGFTDEQVLALINAGVHT